MCFCICCCHVYKSVTTYLLPFSFYLLLVCVFLDFVMDVLLFLLLGVFFYVVFLCFSCR